MSIRKDTDLKSRFILFASAMALVGGLAACDVEVEEKGKLPEVDVDAPDVDVKMKEKTINVPDVDVNMEKKTIKVPDVDVDLPKDEEPDADLLEDDQFPDEE